MVTKIKKALADFLSTYTLQEPRIVFFSGAGMSAESGISTFRDAGGLWEKHSIEEVATPQAFALDPEKVLSFYNQRRRQLLQCDPNPAHFAMARIARSFNTKVITQNVDDLHERAGSETVIHLHGELRKVRSSGNPQLIYELDGWELKIGDCCEEGHQLRPHVVWFGEEVPMMEVAAAEVASADLMVVVGTSLNVYPAAGLVDAPPAGVPRVIIDPADLGLGSQSDYFQIKASASRGMQILEDYLNESASV